MLVALAALAGALAAPAKTSVSSSGYVGSARCASCHKRQAELWRGDWHSRALAPANASTVVARFDPPAVYDGRGTHAVALREGARFVMKAEARGGGLQPFPVEWVVGGRRMQDFLTTLAGGRIQALPIYWHVTGGGEWVDYTTIKQGALTREHPFFWANYARTFNKECLSCHVTGESIGWDERAEAFETSWSEPGVACEKCHGPGAKHARDGEPRSIVRATALPPDRGGAICASCHMPRAPWRSAFSPEGRFRPGQRFDDVYEPVTPILAPGDLSGDFWVDGRPSVGSMEAASLEQSACARKGGMTCFTCHTAPHGRGGLSELREKARTGEVCVGCHARYASREAAARHAFHEPGSPGAACAACHMPKTLVGVLDPQADHALDVPVPENTRDHGVPDACGACHADRGAGWAIAELEKRFPGSTRRARRIRLARAFAAASRGDASAESDLVAILGDRSESEALRANAVMGLFTTPPGPRAREALVAALADPSKVVAARAARALGTRRDRSAADALDAAARSSRDAVALSAALALLDLADPRGVERTKELGRRRGLAGDYRLETALAILDRRAGNSARALSHARRAIADRPDFVPAREIAAALLESSGRKDEAARERALLSSFRHEVTAAAH